MRKSSPACTRRAFSKRDSWFLTGSDRFIHANYTHTINWEMVRAHCIKRPRERLSVLRRLRKSVPPANDADESAESAAIKICLANCIPKTHCRKCLPKSRTTSEKGNQVHSLSGRNVIQSSTQIWRSADHVPPPVHVHAVCNRSVGTGQSLAAPGSARPVNRRQRHGTGATTACFACPSACPWCHDEAATSAASPSTTSRHRPEDSPTCAAWDEAGAALCGGGVAAARAALLRRVGWGGAAAAREVRGSRPYVGPKGGFPVPTEKERGAFLKVYFVGLVSRL